MSPADLLCLYCQRPAFAVINIEIAAGRGRWPTCRDRDCINRALFDGGIRLANAAGIRLVPSAIEVTEANAIDVREYNADEDETDEWINPVTGHGADCGCTSCYLSQTQ